MKEFFKRLFPFLFPKKKPEVVTPVSAPESTHIIVDHPGISKEHLDTVIDRQKQTIKETHEVIADKPVTKVRVELPAQSPKKYKPGMRNNRLHIEYSGNGREGRNSYIENGKQMKAEAMYKGRIDSMRVTKLERAKEIVKGIQAHCIERATFKDATGTEFKIA